MFGEEEEEEESIDETDMGQELLSSSGRWSGKRNTYESTYGPCTEEHSGQHGCMKPSETKPIQLNMCSSN